MQTPHTLDMTFFAFSPLVGASGHYTPKQADTRTVFFPPSRRRDEHITRRYPTSLMHLTDTSVKLETANTQAIFIVIVLAEIAVVAVHNLSLFTLHCNQRVAKSRRKNPRMYAHTYLAIKPDCDSDVIAFKMSFIE